MNYFLTRQAQYNILHCILRCVKFNAARRRRFYIFISKCYIIIPPSLLIVCTSYFRFWQSCAVFRYNVLSCIWFGIKRFINRKHWTEYNREPNECQRWVLFETNLKAVVNFHYTVKAALVGFYTSLMISSISGSVLL